MRYWRVWTCSQGHLFTSPFLWSVSLKSVRLGTARFQRCPECRRFRLCRLADESTLTAEQRAEAAAHRTSPIP